MEAPTGSGPYVIAPHLYQEVAGHHCEEIGGKPGDERRTPKDPSPANPHVGGR